MSKEKTSLRSIARKPFFDKAIHKEDNLQIRQSTNKTIYK